jgi:hypothetical protein
MWFYSLNTVLQVYFFSPALLTVSWKTAVKLENNSKAGEY